MDSKVIFLDESGDLGWRFDAPYRLGGSSRHLTISAIILPEQKKHLPARTIKDLYLKHKWPPKQEKKWAKMSPEERLEFALLAEKLKATHPDIEYTSITVYKPNVRQHIRNDANKLYNYMIGLLLLDRMAQCDKVLLVPDSRELKVASGNSLHDYLLTELWFNKKTQTQVINQPRDSASDRGVQFADMLSGLVQQYHEDTNTALFKMLQCSLFCRKLYFQQKIDFPISNDYLHFPD